MPIRKRVGRDGEDERVFIGVLDRIDDPSDEERPGFHTPTPEMWKTNFLFDAVSRYNFLEGDFIPDNPSSMPLIRVVTTKRKMSQLIGVMPGIGDLYKITIQQYRGADEKRPLAWLITSDGGGSGGYRSSEAWRVLSIEYISSSTGVVPPIISEASLRTRIAPAFQAYRVSSPISPAALLNVGRSQPRWRKVTIESIDVGQASFITIHDGTSAYAYFDVGEPLAFNWTSRPRVVSHFPPKQDAFVVLSHWDFDHFLFGKRHPEIFNLPWYAPEVSGGPNTKKFANSLGSRLHTIRKGTRFSLGGIDFHWATGAVTDKNNSGLLAIIKRRVNGRNEKILLTGDADYDYVPTALLKNLTGISVPHHAAKSDSLPPIPIPGLYKPKAVISAGKPNKYGHPTATTISAHLGWDVRVTGEYDVTVRRGNKIIRTL